MITNLNNTSNHSNIITADLIRLRQWRRLVNALRITIIPTIIDTVIN